MYKAAIYEISIRACRDDITYKGCIMFMKGRRHMEKIDMWSTTLKRYSDISRPEFLHAFPQAFTVPNTTKYEIVIDVHHSDYRFASRS